MSRLRRGAPIHDRSAARWRAELGGPRSDPRALADLAELLRGGLRRVLRHQRHMQECDVEDFVQESLLSIVRSLPDFRGDSRFSTWALAIATRVAFTELRRRRFLERGTGGPDPPRDDARPLGVAPAESPESHAARRDLLDVLRRSIDTVLSERQRAVVVGELSGTPTAILAERLGTNRNALYKLHHDARRKLRAALIAAGFTAADGDRIGAMEVPR